MIFVGPSREGRIFLLLSRPHIPMNEALYNKYIEPYSRFSVINECCLSPLVWWLHHSSGRRIKSGSMVLFCQGETATWGHGGSARSWRFALRRDWPIVLIPMSAPADRKFLPWISPAPWGFTCAHWLLGSDGRSSMGLICSRG